MRRRNSLDTYLRVLDPTSELGEFSRSGACRRAIALGLDVQTEIAHTGVFGILTGDRPGPVAAVRSALDALPVTEEISLPFQSTARSTYNGQDRRSHSRESEGFPFKPEIFGGKAMPLLPI
jgi:hypothetical protein